MSLTARQLVVSTRRKAKLLELCRTFPKVEADEAGKDHVAFRVQKKIFAYYLFDHHGDGRIAFTCKSNLSTQQRLVRDDPDEFFVPPYLGSKGWIAIRMDLDNVDWMAIEELARWAYQQTAPKKLAALVEERS